jgi:GAF domain-containing protein/HAMP domain-containing protein
MNQQHNYMDMNSKNIVKRRHSARSLMVTLALAFFGLSAAVLLISTGLLLYTSIRTQQHVILNTQQFIAQDFSDKVSNFIEEKFSSLEAMTKVVDLAKGSAEQKKLILESVLVTQPSFRQIVLLDASGEGLAQFSRISLALSDQFTTLLQSEALPETNQGQRYISQIYIDNITNEPMVVMALPVNIWEFQGTLAVEVDLEFMWNLVEQLKVGETGYAYVVDNRGNLIAFSDTSRVLQGENVQHISEVKAFIENPTLTTDIAPKVVSYTGLLGTTVVGTYVPLGTPEWAVFTELPWREAYQDVITQGIWSLLITLGMASLAGMIGIFAAQRLSVPLTNLTETATKITEGNLELEASVEGPNEVIRLANAFNSMTSQLRDLIGSLERRVADRTSELEESSRNAEKRASQLEAIADVANSVASLQDVNELLPYITQTISDRFGFYHTGIFLLSEDKEYAILRAANSEGGQKMLARKHQLRIGQEGVVGYSIAQKRAHIALDVGEDAVFFNNPNLPATRSELTLPLLIGSDAIGALDVQSEQPNAFSNDDVEVLTTLANQVAVAIENARLFQQSQNALRELDQTFQRYVSNEWQQFAANSKVTGYRAGEAGLEPITNTQKDRKPSNGNKAAQKIPIMLRGATLGALSIDMGERTQAYTEEEFNLIKTVADRLALALESARLLEDSQQSAAKEQIIGEITGKIGSSINLRNVLQTAVEELGHAIPGSEVVIQLNPKTDSEAK